MEKRALYAFDNKRILLEDGIHTLAIGHKDVTAEVQEDRIENPHADDVFPERKAREMGLFWSRRKGAQKRAGIDLTARREENEDVAIAAGQASRAHLRQMLDHVPDFPDRYNPLDARPPKALRHASHSPQSDTRPKRQRVEISSESEGESEQSYCHKNICQLPQPLIHFHRGIARIDSDSSQADAPSLPIEKPSRRTRKNSFVDDEAREGDASSSESDSPDTASKAHADHSSHSPSENEADSSDSDLDFVVGDDCFD